MSGNKRRWFQIHLSTSIVMLVVAGGILYLNMRPTSTDIVKWKTIADVDEHIVNLPIKLPPSANVGKKSMFFDRQQTTRFGWPFASKQVLWTNSTARRFELTQAEYETLRGSTKYVENRFTIEMTWDEFITEVSKMRKSQAVDESLAMAGSASITSPGTWNLDSLIYNVLIALGMVVAFAMACEWSIRRREARKP